MNLITDGMGKGQMLITEGYGKSIISRILEKLRIVKVLYRKVPRIIGDASKMRGAE